MGGSLAYRQAAQLTMWGKPHSPSEKTFGVVRQHYELECSTRMPAGAETRQPAFDDSIITFGAPAPAAAWSLQLSETPCVQDGFAKLSLAIKDYNVEATQQKRDLIEAGGVQLNHVLKVAGDLQVSMENLRDPSKTTEKMKAGLRTFCETSLYYSNIVDTLIQHNPEWTAFAWGAIKFLLLVPIEYQRVKESIMSYLGSLGEKFKIVRIFAQFFPAGNIADTVGVIYAAFSQFLEVSIRWLKANQLKRLIKSTFQPFDTSIKPAVERFNHGYEILKEQIEVNRFLRDISIEHQQRRDLLSLDSSAKSSHKKLDEIIHLLQDLMSSSTLSVTGRASQLLTSSPAGPESAETTASQQLLHDLEPEKETQEIISSSIPSSVPINFGDFAPLSQDLERVRSRQAIMPMANRQLNLDILAREDFKTWVRSSASGILWIDGYEIPARPNWVMALASNLVQAALFSGYETLFDFGTLCSDNSQVRTPIQFIHRLVGHLLKKYPESMKRHRAESLAGTPAAAAKTDLSTSWGTLLQLLSGIEARVIYIVFEAPDKIFRDLQESESPQIQELFLKISSLTLPDTIRGKVVKIFLTSTQPQKDMEAVFGSAGGSDVVRIAVSPAMSRCRVQRSRVGRRRLGARGDGQAFSERPAWDQETITLENEENDFAPREDECSTLSSSTRVTMKTTVKAQSDEEFDIFS